MWLRDALRCLYGPPLVVTRQGDPDRSRPTRQASPCVIEPVLGYPQAMSVPGPPRRELTTAERQRLLRLTERIRSLDRELTKAKREWAGLVRKLGLAAVGREIGLTRQAVAERLKVIERR